MSKYMETLGMISPTAGGVKRAADIVAALAPPSRVGADMPSTSLTKVSAGAKKSVTEQLTGLVPGVVGGAAGALLWKKHRFLGLAGGHAIGSSVGPLLKGGTARTKALHALGVEGAAIGGALVCKSRKHPLLYPLLGYVAGGALGALVDSFIPGSPVRERYDRWRASK